MLIEDANTGGLEVRGRRPLPGHQLANERPIVNFTISTTRTFGRENSHPAIMATSNGQRMGRARKKGIRYVIPVTGNNPGGARPDGRTITPASFRRRTRNRKPACYFRTHGNNTAFGLPSLKKGMSRKKMPPVIAHRLT